MDADYQTDPVESFALFIQTLVQAITGTLSLQQEGNVLLWRRLQRLGALFTAILAGTWRPRTSPRAATASRGPPQPPKPSQPNPNLPIGGFGALLRQLTDYYQYRGALEHLLAKPEMRALIEATPQLRRVLNPLCRMLRLKPLPPLNPRPRSPSARPSVPSLAPSKPQPAEQAESPPAATPQRAPRASGPPPAPPSLWSLIERDLKLRKNLIFRPKPADSG